MRRAIVETYTDRMYWWEASLMAQRLVGLGCACHIFPCTQVCWFFLCSALLERVCC